MLNESLEEKKKIRKYNDPSSGTMIKYRILAARSLTKKFKK